MCGHDLFVDPRNRALAVVASAVLTAGVMSGCAEWQAQVAQERGIPFGSGEYDGQVAARSGLNVRSEPTTDSDVRATLVNGVELRIDCKAEGETIEGDSTWYKLGFQRWVSARYVADLGPEPAWCD